MRLPGIVLATVLSAFFAASACSTPMDPDGLPDGPRMHGVAAVGLNPMAAELAVGAVFSMDASLIDPRGQPLTGRRVDWKSSDPAIATVSKSGDVQAVSTGEVTIFAASEGRAGSSSVRVRTSTDVNSIRILSETNTVPLNGTLKLNSEVRDTSNRVLSEREVAWRSSNNSFATVDSKGVVSGVKVGNVTITASAGGLSSSVVLNIRAAEVAIVAVQPGSSALLVGESVRLSAVLSDVSGNPLNQRSVSWSTSNSSVAGVSGNGTVTGREIGTSTITATSEGKTGTATVTVVPNAAAQRVTVAPSSANMYPGDNLQLQASVLDDNGRVINGASVQWSSSNSGIASVASSGAVKAVAPGSATITASSEGKSGTATITVRSATVASITLSPTSLSLEVGKTAQVTATLRDAHGALIVGRTISWTSSNTSVATVSDGLVSARETGTATVKATADGVSSSVGVSVVPSSAPGGTAWPNRPSGLNLLSNRQFSSKARHSTDVVGAEGWSPSQEYNRDRITIINDATAPLSPGGVAQYLWKQGDGSGTGHSRQDFPLPGAVQTLHVGAAFKASDTFFGNDGAGVTKQMYFWEARNNANVYLGLTGKEMGSLRFDMFVQGAGDTPAKGIARRLNANVGNVTIQRGRWYKLEILMVGNSRACSNYVADGQLHIWVNNQKTHDYRDVCYDSQAGAKFRLVNTTSIWGGVGTEIPHDFYTYWDHMQISGK